MKVVTQSEHIDRTLKTSPHLISVGAFLFPLLVYAMSLRYFDYTYGFNVVAVQYSMYTTHSFSLGNLPDNPSGNGACNSLYDPTVAPSGKHAAFWWPYSVYELRNGGAKAWDEIREDYAEILLNTWREFAPNMTAENVLAKYLYTPLDIERRHVNMKRGDQHGGAYTVDQWGMNRPHRDLATYRTPIKKLYLCASSSHPGGGVTFGPGYNAANAVADDLGLKKWWTPIQK